MYIYIISAAAVMLVFCVIFQSWDVLFYIFMSACFISAIVSSL